METCFRRVFSMIVCATCKFEAEQKVMLITETGLTISLAKGTSCENDTDKNTSRRSPITCSCTTTAVTRAMAPKPHLRFEVYAPVHPMIKAPMPKPFSRPSPSAPMQKSPWRWGKCGVVCAKSSHDKQFSLPFRSGSSSSSGPSALKDAGTDHTKALREAI